MKLYGWEEQDEVTWGISVINVEPLRVTIIDDCSDFREREVDEIEGRWFTTFFAAKTAALDHWRVERITADLAIKAIKKKKKADIDVINKI